MRYSVAEKRELIHLVEHSDLSIRRTLEELEVPRSSFYRWYRRFQEDGLCGLETKPVQGKRFWNRIPESVREQIVELALEYPDQSSGSWPGSLPTNRDISSQNQAFIAF